MIVIFVRTMFGWIFLCCLSAFVSRSSCYTDLTREAKAHGTDVVITCVRLIRDSRVLDPIDLELLRKIALIESMDGDNAFTYASNNGGGIWGIDKTAFDATRTNLSEDLSNSIFNYFGIQWKNVEWDDLDKPLYSALAAGIYLHLFNESSSSRISLWRDLNGRRRADEDFLQAVVSDSHEIYVEPEEIAGEDHVRRQLQTSQMHLKVDVSELSTDIEVDFSIIDSAASATLYVSDVQATSSVIFCGFTNTTGRLFLNINSMFQYGADQSSVLYITVVGDPGTKFDVVVESSTSTGDVDFGSDSDEFIIGMFSNHPDVGPLPIKLLLTTMESEPVVVTVENMTSSIINVTVMSGTPTEIMLPDDYVVSFVNETQKGLLVKTSSGKKIGVSVGSSYVYSTDSYNAIPVIEYAGLKEYTYYGITPYTNVTGLKSRLLVVGKHGNTRLTITPSQDATINNMTLNGNQSYVIELNRLETLLIESEQSLTGSKVVSDKPVSFLAGHQCAVVPESGTSCDFAIEQFPPTVTYGKQFMLQMLSSRTGGSHFTILTSEKDTNISLWCGLASSNQTIEHTILLDSPGSFKALEIAPDDVTCSLVANQPCILAVFGTSENNDENDGDPLLIMIPPVEQFSTTAMYWKNENLTNTYVNLIVMGSDYSSLKMDNSPLSISEWKEIRAPSLGTDDIFGFAARFEANDFMLHTIKAENDATQFSVILYGFDFSVGYGQRTGMLLKPIASEGDSALKPELSESIQGKQLTCSTGGPPAHAFTWQIHGSSDSIATSTSKYSLSSNGFTESILTINDPSSTDSGLYTCNIYSYHGSTSINDTITVKDPTMPNDESPSVNFRKQEYGNTENESVSIDATVSNVDLMNYVISWRFINYIGTITDITNDTEPNKFVVSENGYSLSVLNLQLGEDGTIAVAVRSKGLTVSQEAVLQIYVAISLAPASVVSNRTERVGNSVTFTCHADGIDAPFFIWRFNEKLLVNSDKFYISSTNTTPLRNIEGILSTSTSLTVKSLMEDDQGIYHCVANNKALVSRSNSFTLQVLSPDHCVSNLCENGRCINLNTTYRCECQIGYEGEKCDSKIQPTKVFIKPTINVPPSDLWVNLYDKGELTCVANGIPDPQIKWFKNNAPYDNNNEDMSRLSFESVKLDDRGIYHCSATNIDGEGEPRSENSSKVILNIENVVQYTGMINITSMSQSNIDKDSVTSLFTMINEELIGTMIDGSTYFLIQPVNEPLDIPPNTIEHSVPILVTLLIDTSTEWNSANLLAATTLKVSQLSQSLLMTASLTTTQEERFDGCAPNQTFIPSQTGNDNLTLIIQWPETNIGATARVPCPCGDVSSDTSLVATRYCEGNFVNGGQWRTSADDDKCDFSDLARELCKLTELEVPERIQRLDVLTDSPKLNETEVAISVSILAITASEVVGNITLSDGFLNVTDNILSLNESVLQNTVSESNSTARLREALFTLIDGLPIDDNDNNTIILKSTFAVAVQRANFENFTESSFSVKTNDTNEKYKAVYERTDDPDAAITLPATLFTNKSIIETNRSVISNSVFLNDNAFQVRNIEYFKVGGVIVSAKVVGYGENAFNNLKDPVELTIQFKNSTSDKEPICVFFDTQADDGRGMWSTEGCFRNVSSVDGTVQCFCNHLTSFSILLDLSPNLTSSALLHSDDALTSISYIGLCISIICLTITIISYLSSKKLRKLELSQLLVNLCVALIGLYITFIIAIYARHDTVFCSIISSALHYFFLVTFVSMAMEAIRLYIKLIIVLKTVHGFVIKSVIISWVLPIFFVLFSIAPDYENYVNKYICRPSGVPYYVGMVAPFVAIYIFNWTIYILTFVGLIKRSLHKRKAEDGDSSMHHFLRQQLITAILLSTLLGIGWGIGLLVTEHVNSDTTQQIVSTLFVLLTAFHGLFVFIMHCLRSQDVRNEWKHWFFGLTRQKLTETKTEESSMKRLYEKVKPAKKSRRNKLNEIQLTTNASFTFTNSNNSANDYEDATLKYHVKKHQKNEETQASALFSPTDEKLPDIYEYETIDPLEEKTGHDAV